MAQPRALPGLSLAVAFGRPDIGMREHAQDLLAGARSGGPERRDVRRPQLRRHADRHGAARARDRGRQWIYVDAFVPEPKRPLVDDRLPVELRRAIVAALRPAASSPPTSPWAWTRRTSRGSRCAWPLRAGLRSAARCRRPANHPGPDNSSARRNTGGVCEETVFRVLVFTVTPACAMNARACRFRKPARQRAEIYRAEPVDIVNIASVASASGIALIST